MKRTAISLIGILCLAIWACAAPAPPTPPTVTSAPASFSCADGSDLFNRVHYTTFTPPQPIADNSIPPSDSTAIDPDIQQNLLAAFNANPSFAQNQLCHLDGIYINLAQCSSHDPASCSTMTDRDIADNSWGYRTPEPSVHRYVAISLGLWRNNQCQGGQKICAPPFQEYDARLIRALLDRTAQPNPSSPPPPPFPNPPMVQASLNDSGTSVLAALAHETGHIYWWDTFVPHAGDPHATNTATFCNGNFYPGGIWEGAAVDVPPHRWVDFGYVRQPPQAYVAQLSQVLTSGPGHSLMAGEVLHKIYSRGTWASALAAYSPDEDFVESFELSVLHNGGLQNLTVVVLGGSDVSGPIIQHPEAIVQNGTVASALGTKLQCFDVLSRPPQPR